jgi:hypothetical protein
MLLLYTFTLFVLCILTWLVERRARRLEKRYFQTAKAAETLAREPVYRCGNTNRPDLYATAKRQYLLALAVQKRDRLEGKYAGWQGLAQTSRQLVARLRNWKGRKLPYTLGVLDVACALYALDYLGAAEYAGAAAGRALEQVRERNCSGSLGVARPAWG